MISWRYSSNGHLRTDEALAKFAIIVLFATARVSSRASSIGSMAGASLFCGAPETNNSEDITMSSVGTACRPQADGPTINGHRLGFTLLR